MINQLLKSAKYGACKELVNNDLERDASVVVAVTPVSFVLVQGDYFGITHILGNTSLPPALARDFMQG